MEGKLRSKRNLHFVTRPARLNEPFRRQSERSWYSRDQEKRIDAQTILSICAGCRVVLDQESPGRYCVFCNRAVCSDCAENKCQLCRYVVCDNGRCSYGFSGGVICKGHGRFQRLMFYLTGAH